MENAFVCPELAGGTLTPKQAKKFFEFFSPGTEREVLVLGDLAEQHVHYVRSKGHKVLCGARVGRCDLCEKAGSSDDVSDQQVEYYAASFVQAPKDREMHQRVAVFTAVSGEELLRLVPEGSLRGHRFSVRRESTQKFKLRLLAGPPRGLSNVIPVAFDLLPFVRARFGRPQSADRPFVCLPPLRSKDLVSGPAHRPRPLDVSAEDCTPSPEVLAKLHEYVNRFGGGEQPPPVAAPTPGPTQPPPIGTPAPADDQAEDVETTPPPVKSIDVPAIAANPANYGPRKQVNGQHTPTTADTTPGADLIGGILANHPALRNGRKGGA